jgi:hypothetical protein
MALPVLEKTWQYNVNQAIASAAILAQCQSLMYAIKSSMISVVQHPWTVWGSCDSLNFGNNDGVDRWAAAANCVWPVGVGNAYSWIVLTQAALGGNFSICIALDAPSAYTECTIVMSPLAGFSSDGALNARPTATDEIVIISKSKWGCTTTGTRAQKLHYLQSTDGQCSRVAVHSNSVNHCLWMFESLKDAATTSWANPSVVMIAASTTGAAYTTVNNLSSALTPLFRASIAGNVARLCMTTASGNVVGTANLVTTQTFADEDSGEWPLFPVFVDSVIVPTRGRKGMLYDFWFGSSGLANGTQYPADASRTFAQMGQVVVPWDGTAIAIV